MECAKILLDQVPHSKGTSWRVRTSRVEVSGLWRRATSCWSSQKTSPGEDRRSKQVDNRKSQNGISFNFSELKFQFNLFPREDRRSKQVDIEESQNGITQTVFNSICWWFCSMHHKIVTDLCRVTSGLVGSYKIWAVKLKMIKSWLPNKIRTVNFFHVTVKVW